MAGGSATKHSGQTGSQSHETTVVGTQPHAPDSQWSSAEGPAGALALRFPLDRPAPLPLVSEEEPAQVVLAVRRPKWSIAVGASLIILALVGVAVARSVAVRALLPLALALAGVAVLLRGSRRRTRPTAPKTPPTRATPAATTPLPIAPPARSLIVDVSGLAIESGASRVQLLDLSSRQFGMTILSDRLRTRAIVAITSKEGACFLAGRILPEDRRMLAPILARALVIPTEEVALDAIGPDGRPVELRAEDFRSVVEWLERVDPSSSDRLILSDPSGEPLELRGEELVVRGHHFDLTRALEWRSILFQESFGQAFALYQGTWVRQGTSEVVLVSLLPAGVLDPSPLDFMRASNPDLDLRAMRDQRLMQATAGAPPPFEQRVAVDGLFMLPLRVALDGAPRASKLPASARHA
jgi:hypothetical protein